MAGFPIFPVRRKLPNVCFQLPVFRKAKRIKVNPDAPQRYVRELALRMGKTVFVPTPRLRAGFKRFDPKTIPKDKLFEAASLSKGSKWGEDVSLKELPQLDAIVTGSVAVTRKGYRCGKGEGYGDIEYGILRELGHAPVPVATTVHAIQLLDHFPRDPIDLPLSFIVTPEETIHVKPVLGRTKGIQWKRLTAEQMKAMPILQDLKRLQKKSK